MFADDPPQMSFLNSSRNKVGALTNLRSSWILNWTCNHANRPKDVERAEGLLEQRRGRGQAACGNCGSQIL